MHQHPVMITEVDEFYSKLQTLADQTLKQDILVVEGDWNSEVGEDAHEDWGEVCEHFCNLETNDRGLKLLDFATFNNIVLANTLGSHKPPRRWKLHSPDGTHHNQIDYILVKKQFRSLLEWPEPEHSKVRMLEAAMIWWWWLSKLALRNQGNQPSQQLGLTERSSMIPHWQVLFMQL